MYCPTSVHAMRCGLARHAANGPRRARGAVGRVALQAWPTNQPLTIGWSKRGAASRGIGARRITAFLPREPKPLAVVTFRGEGSNGLAHDYLYSRTSAVPQCKPKEL